MILLKKLEEILQAKILILPGRSSTTACIPLAVDFESNTFTHSETYLPRSLKMWYLFNRLNIRPMKVKPVESTLMLPSADPLIKQSSVGSTASALTGESWAWKLCRCCLWGSSKTLIQPFLPPVISSCCLGATESTVAPDSWQQKAEETE